MTNNVPDNFINTKKVSVTEKVALGALDTGGGLLAWVNPEDGDILITGFEIDVTTVSSAAATGDFGTTASSAATSSDNLIDGRDLNGSVGAFNNIDDKGSNGKARVRLAQGKWVTGSKASGACAGLVGYAYITYRKL